MPYSKFPDVDALITRAGKALALIEKQYNDALSQQQLPSTLQLDIKDYLQTLRSSLDYVSNRIPGFNKNFPMCEHANGLPNALRGADAATAAVFSKWQPYQHSWLRWFNWLNNEHKHAMLVPQKRSETVQVQVSGGGGGSVTWDASAVKFGSGVSMMGVPIDPRTQMPVPNNVVRTERLTWVDFTFSPEGAPASFGSNVSALPLLKQCFQDVPEIVKELETAIP